MAKSPATVRSQDGPRPGVPRPSATTTAKPCSANHCEVRKMLAVLSTRCECGPPYGSISTGSFVPGSCQDGNSTAVRMPAGPASRNRGAGCGRFGLLARARRSSPAALPVPAVIGTCSRGALHASCSTARSSRPPRRGVHAGRGGDLAQAVGTVAPHADLGGLGRGLEQHVVAVGAEDLPDLQAGRGERPRPARSPGGATISRRVSSLISVQTTAPSSSWAGTPPMMSVHCGSVSSRIVSPVSPLNSRMLLLVAGLHDDQQVLVPGRGDQVREADPVPVHLGELDAGLFPGSSGGDEQRHLGVRRACRGISDDVGLAVRVGRVGDVPAPDR